MRCGEDGTLLGATLSDHGYTIISMFFDAAPTADEAAAAAAALAGPGATVDGVAAAAVAPAKSTPTPGRMRTGAFCSAGWTQLFGGDGSRSVQLRSNGFWRLGEGTLGFTQ